MSRSRYVVLMAAVAAIGFAAAGPNVAFAQAKKDDKAAAPAPLKNVIGEIGDSEALYIDAGTFQVAKGRKKGKDDAAALAQKLRAGPLPQGAIIFRSGDKLYLAGAGNAAFMNPMINPAAYMGGVNPAAYMGGVNPAAYMAMVNPAAYMASVNPAAYMASVNPAAYMQSVNPAAYMHSTNPAAYMHSTNPAAYMHSTNPAAYMQSTNPAAYMQSTNPAAYMQSTNPASYMKGDPGMDKDVAPGTYMRNAFDDNFNW